MGRLDIRRLAWGINRLFLVHGVLAWVAAVGAATLLASLWLLVGSARHHAALEARLGRYSGTAVAAAVRDEDERLPFPAYAERFALTARTLEALRIDESQPGKIAFRYDRDPEAGLVRQTATLNLTSRWQDLGALLDRAQTAIPTAYISRLQLSRDSEMDPALGAEVQFTLVFMDATQGSAE